MFLTLNYYRNTYKKKPFYLFLSLPMFVLKKQTILFYRLKDLREYSIMNNLDLYPCCGC